MNGAIRGLRIGDLAGVDGAICDGFCDMAVGSGRERRGVRENMVAVESKSEARYRLSCPHLTDLIRGVVSS